MGSRERGVIAAAPAAAAAADHRHHRRHRRPSGYHSKSAKMSYSATDQQQLLRRLIFLFVVSLAVTAATSLETSGTEESDLPPSEFDSLSEIDSSGGADEERRRKGRFFQFRRTSTTTTTSTTASPTLCYTTSTITGICAGRKKRALEAVIRSLPMHNGPASVINPENIQPTRRQMMDYLAAEHRREMTKRDIEEIASSSAAGELMSAN